MIYIKSKIFSVIIIVLVTVSSIWAQSNERALLLTYIDGKAISGKTLNSVVADLAKLNNIPISLEPETFTKSLGIGNNELQLKNKEKVIQIKNGTLEDVLNQIMSFHPSYEWKFEDGVVQILPKNNKDTVVFELLNTEISEIIIEKRVGVMSAGDFITNTNEVKNKLKSLGITDIHFYNSVEGLKFDKDSSQLFFVIKNKSVKDILNQIVKDSNSKFWTIVRWGNKGEFLTIIVS